MKVENKDYKKIAFIVGYITLALLMLVYTLKELGKNNSFNSKGYIVFVAGLIVAVVITAIILIKFNKKSIEKQFLIIALIWGTSFAVINPAFLVPDEIVHVNRAYDIAKGRFFYKANEDTMVLPFGLYNYEVTLWNNINKEGMQKYVDSMKVPLDKDKLIKYNADQTGAYNTIAYLPQSIGIFIGDLLNLPTYFVIVLGRLTNLLVWIGLGYLSLKFIPIKEELLFLIMFTPIGIQQAASCSPDALLNSASFLLIAYILNLKFIKKDVNYKNILLVIFLTVLIGSVKLPYIVIGGLIILIPNKKIKFKWMGKALIITMIALVNIAVLIGWKTLSKPKVTNTNNEVVVTVEEATSAEKVNWVSEVIKNPKLFINKILTTLRDSAKFYRESFTAYLGWFKVEPPESFTWIILGSLLLFAIKGDDNNYLLNIFDRVLFFLLVAGIFTVICLVSYQWMNKPLSEINIFMGIQGRYFYPFIIGLPMIIQNSVFKLKNSEFWINNFRNLYVCWTIMFSLGMIMNCYFIANI